MSAATATMNLNGNARTVPGVPCWRWLALSAAFWPVWVWYVSRLFDGSDEPLGLAALAAAAAVLAHRRPNPGWPVWNVTTVSFLAAYVVAYPWAPALVRAALAMGALCSAMGRFPGWPGVCGLALLSLPIEATAQFFLGYPLRVLAGWIATSSLNLAGLAVEQQGVALAWRGEILLIDAPCSGIKMLWLGGLLVFGIAAWRGLAAWRTLGLGCAALLVLLAGNGLRNAALFLVEMGLCPSPSWAHGAVGLLLLAGCAVSILALGEMLAKHNPRLPARAAAHGAPRRDAALFGLCGVAALAPLWSGAPAPNTMRADARDWPSQFEGRTLVFRPLTGRDERFARDFPGRIAIAGAAGQRIVFRSVSRPTRLLHPASHCLRGAGYTLKPLPAWRDPEGGLWARVQAARAGETRVAREQIRDPSGRTWSDVSSWYWAAVMRRTQGPWLAITVLETE